MLYCECGTLLWSILRQRLWLDSPRSSPAGKTDGRLWWWLIPLILLTAAYEILARGLLGKMWVSIFPFWNEPEGFSFTAALASPDMQAGIRSAWGVWFLFLISALFNTFLGEELLFRGLLLPRMAGVFGRWDWLVNGLLFGLYHLHQPWGILSSAVSGSIFYALPSRYFRSAWFGIIAHSGQNIFFLFLLLGLVLGLNN